MSRCDLAILGAGPAGHAAAAAYRGAGGAGDVVLVAAEGRLPYRRPPLSKELLRGETEPDDLLLEEATWYAEHAIDIRHAHVDALDAGRRTLTFDDGAHLGYERCIIATGAEPLRPSIPGAAADGVHVLRSVDDALALRAAASSGTRVLVLGSGFIGSEAAASLAARGCQVELVSQEAAPQAARLGPEVGERLAGWLAEAGVQVHYERELAGIEPAGGGLRGRLDDDTTIASDLVLLAAGVKPRSELAADAGVPLAEGDEVAVDRAMRTSDLAILACGDCCRAEHAIAGRPLHVEHWGDALAQGEVAGRTAAGSDAAWDTVPGFWSTIGERTLKYAAWGDGYDRVRIVDDADGSFTAWYAQRGTCVGVLTHGRDEDYEEGRRLIERGGSAR